jgi:alpha-ribazole phosphatase
MPITLLRHAPIPKGYHGRYLGHTDIPIDYELFTPITLPQKYDLIYSSDLNRCTQTLEALGYTDVIPDTRLREVCFKEMFEGKNFEEIERMKEYSPQFLESRESWHTFICEESIENFRGRIQSFLEELPSDQNILICSHAGTLYEMLSLLNSLPKRLDYLEHTIVGENR